MKTEVSLLVSTVLLLGCAKHLPDVWSGYAEGEYIQVAAPFAGALTHLSVKRGDTVRAQQPLFVLEQVNERASREQAQAQLAHAQAQLQDLLKGKRAPELDAVRAQLAQAEASLAQSQAQFKRDQTLVERSFISRQQLDQSRAAFQRDRARVDELNSQLTVAKLAARPDQIAAAQHDVDAAKDALTQADWKLAQKSQVAPTAALVTDTLYVQGEWVQAGTPVVSLLPPANIKVRFYVGETRVGGLRPGQAVTVSCDGCASAINAHISYISPQAEYTPPVIYSRENRSKLMFLVEARPAAADATKLHPGQPVEVSLTGRSR
jgi:HlyD family secretion protein